MRLLSAEMAIVSAAGDALRSHSRRGSAPLYERNAQSVETGPHYLASVALGTCELALCSDYYRSMPAGPCRTSATHNLDRRQHWREAFTLTDDRRVQGQ
jgi:hypothetical protein